jgi:hypothetical protein
MTGPKQDSQYLLVTFAWERLIVVLINSIIINKIILNKPDFIEEIPLN